MTDPTSPLTPAGHVGTGRAETGMDAGPVGAASVRLTVNGEPREMAAGSSAHDVIVAAGLVGRPLAVEVNERIVPRRDLPACMLHDGDRIEIVTLVGGG